MKKAFHFLIFMVFCLFSFYAQAVQPDEILPDATLEARARDISTHLRCLVCQNETIDDSNAPLARDLRLLVRERLVQGDSNEQAINYIVARYGDYVLLKPRFEGTAILLWLSPLVILVLVFIYIFYAMKNRNAVQPKELNDEEKRRLKKILNE